MVDVWLIFNLMIPFFEVTQNQPMVNVLVLEGDLAHLVGDLAHLHRQPQGGRGQGDQPPRQICEGLILQINLVNFLLFCSQIGDLQDSKLNLQVDL